MVRIQNSGSRLLSTLVACTALSSLPLLAQDSWRQVGLAGERVNSIVATASGASLIASSNRGLYRSTDDGATWSRTHGSTNRTWYLTLAPEGKIFAASDGGLLRSDDDGGMWTPVLTATQAADAFGRPKSLAVDAAGSIFVGANTAVHRSTDGGTTWQALIEGLPENYPDVGSLAAMPGGGLLAGTQGIMGGHVFATVDGGESWQQIFTAGRDADVSSLGITRSGTIIVALGDGRILRSEDEGSTWETATVPVGQGEGLGAIETSGTSLFVGSYRGRVFRSDDGGRSWSEIAGSGLPTSGLFGLRVDRRGNLLAAAATGIYALGGIASVHDQAAVRASVTTHPNPASEWLEVACSLESRSTLAIEILDLGGMRIRWSEQGPLDAGAHRFRLDVREIPAGTYLVRIETPRGNAIAPVVIAR